MLSFCQIKIHHFLKSTLKAISSNYIPVIISNHAICNYNNCGWLNNGQDEMETNFGKNYVTVYTQYNYGEV